MNNALVRILTNDDPRQPVGAGFLVSPHHILTGAHVVAQALKLPKNTPTRPKDIIYLDFPLLSKRPLLQATVHQWYPLKDHVVKGEFEDICVLVLSTQTPQPSEARSIPIIAFEEEAFEKEFERTVRMCGFPEHQDNGVCLNGTLQKTIAPGLVQIEIKSKARLMITGFSGTPVWDKQEHAVAGIIVNIEHQDGKTTAQMITAASLVKAWPELELYSSPNPYRGLQAFSEKDSEYFFGRETLIQPLHTAVEKQPFVAVIGTRGSGKTSLIFAGLVPRLRQENWLIIQCCPKNQPFSELSKAFVPFVYPKLNPLKRRDKQNQFADKLSQRQMSLSYVINLVFNEPKLQGKRLLLIIEQFEQLYTLNSNEVQQRFLATLLQSIDLTSQQRGGGRAPDFTLLLSMRADVMGQALTHSGLAEVLNNYHKAILGPMTSDNLTAAIEKPAGNQGITLEAGLTDRILQDLGQAPGHLSLLQFTLTQLWERLEYWQLTQRAYNAIGGVNNALGHHAEKFYNHLNDLEKQLLRGLMLQLVRPNDGLQYTREVAIRAHLGVDHWDLVIRLAKKGLVIIERNEETGQETVQLADSALISHWQPLHDWIDEDRRFCRWQTRLRQALQTWKNSDQSEASLLQDEPLTEAEEQLKNCANQLGTQERDFIKASIASSQRKSAFRERLRKEQEQFQRRMVFGLASVIVFTLGLSIFAGWQWWKNKQQLIEENTQQAIELKQQAEKTQAEVIQLRLKAIQAHMEAEQGRLKTAEQLQQTEQLHHQVRLSHSLALATISQVESQKGYTTNGILLALEALPKDLLTPDRPYLPYAEKALYEAVFNLREHLVLEGYDAPIRHAAFSPVDSIVLIVAHNDSLVRLWNSDSGKQMVVLKGHQAPVNHATFSPDGQRILTSSTDGTARLWETETGNPLSVMTHKNSIVMYAAFSPDGLKVVTRLKRGSAILWDAKNGKRLHTLVPKKEKDFARSSGPEKIGYQSAFGPPETKLGLPNKIILPTFQNYQVSFSPDGSKIATTGSKQAYLWDAQDGQLLFPLKHENTVTHIAFSQKGSQMITTSFDNTARLWNTMNGKLIQEFKHENKVTYATMSPDEQSVATISNDYTVRLWKTETGQLINKLPHYSHVSYAVFSPNGHYLVTTSYDNLARLWDGLGGQLIAVIPGHESVVYQAAFSHDGRRILTTSADSTVRLWNLLIAGNQFFVMLQKDKESVNQAAFSPDGQRVVTSSADKLARVWNTQTGKLLKALPGHESAVQQAAFSPDGETVITASSENTARLWKVSSGEVIAELSHEDHWQVFKAAFSADGQRIVTIARSKEDKAISTAFLWDAINVKLIDPLKHKMVRKAVFSPTRQYLVTEGGAIFSGTLHIWDGNTGQLLDIMRPNKIISHISFSPDGQHLLLVLPDKTAQLWDINNKKPVLVLQGHDSFVTSAAFSPNGQLIVTASKDRTARVWDANSGQQLQVMRGHQGDVIYAAFGWNDQRVVTASYDGTARFWDVLSGQQLAMMGGHNGRIKYAVFNPKAAQIVTVSNDNRAFLWSLLSTQDIIKIANQNVPRCFTSEQRQRFMLSEPESSRLMENGKALAQEGQIEAAIVEFDKAKQLATCLKFDSKDRANLIAQTSAQRLVEKGLQLVSQRQIKEALATYEKAQQIDESLISTKAWYMLCKNGTKRGYPAQVKAACNEAVKRAPKQEWFRMSRGVTRAVTGDMKGAIEDIQFFVERVADEKDKNQAQAWLKVLRRGINPFTPEVIRRW